MPLYPGSAFYPGGGVVQPTLQLEGVVRVTARNLAAPQFEDLPFEGEGDEVTAIVTDGSALSQEFVVDYDEDAGTGSFTLPRTLTDTCRPLRIEWVHEGGERFVSTVDVRDGQPLPMRMLDRILKTGAENDDTEWPPAVRRAALGDALLALENVCGTALVPRRSEETVHDGTGDCVVLDVANVRRIIATTIDGLNVDDIVVKAGGVIVFPTVVSAPFTLTVEHGVVGPPADVARAVAMLAASALRDGAWDERGITVAQDGAFVALLTAGVRGAQFSIPEVEAVYKRYRVLEVG